MNYFSSLEFVEDSAQARRQSAQLDAADRIFDERGRRPSTFNMISAPPGRVIVVPAGGATTKLAMSQNMELFELKDIIFIFQKFDDDGHGLCLLTFILFILTFG